MRSITQRITLSPERTISPINNNINGFNYNIGSPSNGEHSPGQRVTPPRGKSPSLQTFTNILDRISPNKEMKVSIL